MLSDQECLARNSKSQSKRFDVFLLNARSQIFMILHLAYPFSLCYSRYIYTILKRVWVNYKYYI
jgi:hypothetical protein